MGGFSPNCCFFIQGKHASFHNYKGVSKSLPTVDGILGEDGQRVDEKEECDDNWLSCKSLFIEKGEEWAIKRRGLECKLIQDKTKGIKDMWVTTF